MNYLLRLLYLSLFLALLIPCPGQSPVQARENRGLSRIKAEDKLRHLGVVYANFVTGSGDGFSVELMQEFAKYLGVEYEYVHTTWQNAIPQLIGRDFVVQDNEVKMEGKRDIKGDLIANGLTILDWREKLIDYSKPVFPTQIWLVTRADANIDPIQPSGNTTLDINAVKQHIQGLKILGKKDTCLDPSLYNLKEHGAKTLNFQGKINQLAPALLNREAQAIILDVPDALIALRKWGGDIKVIGPVSQQQDMGVGFRKSSQDLSRAFNSFLEKIKDNGKYYNLVEKYYPNAFEHFPEFFDSK